MPELRPGSLHRVQLGPVIPSGKGINVARVAHSWGHPVTAIALTGEGRKTLAEFLDSHGINHVLIPVPGEIRVNVKVFEEIHGRMTELNEPGPAISADAVATLERYLQELCRGAGAVVFSGSLPPGAPPDLYARLVRRVVDAGIPAIVDASGAALRHALATPLFLLKPNRAEAEELLFASNPPPQASDDKLLELLLGFGVPHVILTLGADGALFAHGGRIIHAIPPLIEVGNAAGAGDALLATYLVGVLEGWSFMELVARSTAAGAAAARGLGTDLATPQDVADLLAGVRLVHRA